MAAVVLIGMQSTSHCYPPVPLLDGSSNVFINGMAVGLIGGRYPAHTCGTSTHTPVQSQGSSSVFFNGIAVARIGDQMSCGDVCANGSSNVQFG